MISFTNIFCPKCHSHVTLRGISKNASEYNLHVLCANIRCDEGYTIILKDNNLNVTQSGKSLEHYQFKGYGT